MTVFEGHRARLDGFRRGEREVLSLVYEHYVNEVATMVLRGFSSGEPPVRVPGVPAAEGQADLVQEAFLKAFAPDARLAYDGLSPFRPWLLRIARNLMIDRGRRSGRLVVSSEVAHAAVEGAEPLPAAPEEERAGREPSPRPRHSSSPALHLQVAETLAVVHRQGLGPVAGCTITLK
jgi:DNA-directed RNA polymerase specialized sigma24 family protein